MLAILSEAKNLSSHTVRITTNFARQESVILSEAQRAKSKDLRFSQDASPSPKPRNQPNSDTFEQSSNRTA